MAAVPWYLGAPDPAPVNALQGAAVNPQPLPPPQPGMDAYQMGGMTTGVPQNLLPENFMQQAAPAPAGRPRHSALDIIGRISDVLANVGGAPAQYQPYLDQRADRTMAIDDRQRGIDLENLKRSILETQAPLQTQQMQQQVQAGANELQDTQRARVAEALGGIAGHPDAASMWPQIAEQAGIPADKAAAIGQLIQRNPEMVGALAQSFGFKPTAQGSQPKEIQIYGLLQKQDPEMATTYLKSLSNPDAITPYQQAQLQLSLGRLGMDQEEFGYRRFNDNRNFNYRQQQDATKTDAKAGGASAQHRQEAGAMLDELGGLYGELNKMGALVNPKNSRMDNLGARLGNSGVGQLVGGAIGTEAQTKRDRIASIRPALMQTLAKATGMTGKQLDSNADVKLFVQTITDPTKSYEANVAAINGLKRLLATPAAPTGAPASGGRRIIPNTPRGGWGKATVVK